MTSRRNSSLVWRFHHSQRVPPRRVNTRASDAAAIERWKAAIATRRDAERAREDSHIDEVAGPVRGGDGLAWRVIAILAMILTIATIASLVQSIDRRGVVDRRPKEPSESAGMIAGPLVPRVLALEVEIERDDAHGRTSGVVGQSIWNAHCGDVMRISARLDSPGYAYLLSLNACGDIELMSPRGLAITPQRADMVSFPERIDQIVHLADSPGMQAVLLLVSQDPLPPFGEWLYRRQLRWRSIQANGAWRFDGRVMERLVTDGAITSARLFDAPAPLAALCNTVQSFKDIDACALVAFPVRMKRR